MDPDLGISESVLEKGNNAQRYALRQIERASDEVVDPRLRELNESHFVLSNEGGKCRIVEVEKVRQRDGTYREELSLQSFDDFRNRYMNEKIESGETDKKGIAQMMPLGLWWTKNKQRRQYRKMVFLPDTNEGVVDDCYNLWKGFRVTPKEGDWSLMKAHIRNVLAFGDDASAAYILRWAAWGFQNPARPAEAALVFRGSDGTGKGTFARAVTQAFGQHGMQVTSSDQFVGKFNGHLRDVCLLFADEVTRGCQ
jgi:hypothetical protein